MLTTGISSVSADEWSNEVSSFYYSEHSGDDVDRIKDVSLKYKGIGSFDSGDEVITSNASLDTLTGASPTGTVPSVGTAQVMTSPSGGALISNPNGIDYGNFNDTRVAFSANLDKALNDKYLRGNIGISFSEEKDYQHKGITVSLSKELNNCNTTLSLG